MSTAGLAGKRGESALMPGVIPAAPALPDDIAVLQRLVLAREAELAAAQAELVRAKARETSAEAMILHLRLAIEKMRRELYGQRSERGARLLDQMELELEELEAAASEDELAAERAAMGERTSVRAFTRQRPARKPFPDHLPRERILVPGPTACACCGSTRLAKLGEDVTETLEMVPRSWKVIQTVREKFTCRACEAISQAPAPFHVLPRGFAGPNLLATVVHQPLGRKGQHLPHEVGICPLLDQLDKRHSVVGHRRLPVRFKRRNSNPNRRPAVTAPGVRCAREGLRARPQRIRPTPRPGKSTAPCACGKTQRHPEPLRQGPMR